MGIPEDHIEAMIRQIPAVKASAVLDEILHASRELEQHRLYPDDFAGRFVDDQGELHVLCTKGSSGKYAEILKDFPTVHIEEVEHAYNDLCDMWTRFRSRRCIEIQWEQNWRYCFSPFWRPDVRRLFHRTLVLYKSYHYQ